MLTLQESFLTEKRYNDGISESTVLKYRYFFSLLAGSPVDPEDPSTATPLNYRRHLAAEWSRRSWTPVTYNTARKCYRTYCEWLRRDRLIEANPFDLVPKMREPDKPPRSISSEHAKTLRYALPKLFDLSTFLGLRNCAIFLTFLYTGMRRGELLNLEVGDFDPLVGSFMVRKAKMGKFRQVPVPDQLLPAISDYYDALRREPFRSPLCRFFPSRNGNPLTERNLRSVFDSVSEKLGVRISPHRLRHTFATELVRNDFDIYNVAALLGHSSVRTTQIYLSADPDRIGRKISAVPLYS